MNLKEELQANVFTNFHKPNSELNLCFEKFLKETAQVGKAYSTVVAFTLSPQRP